MLCHFCYVLFFWLRDNLFYLKACEGNKDGHQRTEYVKEAIGWMQMGIIVIGL